MNNGAKGFGGVRITQHHSAVAQFSGIHHVECRKKVDELLFDRFGEIGWAGNGGFHALNLALQFGARAVVLVGFDMSIDKGLHWHGRHQTGMNNPKQASVDKWRKVLDAQRPICDRLGLSVVIGSPNSRLTAFEKLPFMEAIRGASAFVERGERAPG